MEVYENDKEVLKYIRTILLNILYIDDTLKIENLVKFGGIDKIISLYLSSHSIECKQNYFLVIIDYITYQLIQKKKITKIQAELIFDLLSYSDSSIYLTQIFKYLPENFIEKFSLFLYVDLLVKEKILMEKQDVLDQQCIILFSMEIYKIASHYLKLENEFIVRCHGFFNDDNTQEHLKVLKYLLSSKDESERRSGESILFVLLQSEKLEELMNLGDFLMNSLSSGSDVNKLIFLNLIEKNLMYKRSQFKVHHDKEKLKSLLDYLNNNLHLITFTESPPSIVNRMFSIIMDFFSVFKINFTTKDSFQTYRDDIYQTFRDGNIYIPLDLIRELNVNVLLYIFQNTDQENVKILSFLFITELCKKKVNMEAVGGIKFFYNLIENSNAGVSFFSSKFILSQYVKYVPQKYHNNLQILTRKAQMQDNYYILDNEYFQVIELMKK